MKTRTRELAEAIQRITGDSLVKINSQACQFVEQGLCKDREEALKYIFDQAEEEAQHAWADAGYARAVKTGTQPADEES